MADDNNDYLNNLRTIVGRWKKTVNDPNYQPTNTEQTADTNYYNQLPAAMMGAIAPVEGAAQEAASTVAQNAPKGVGIIGGEAAAKQTMNDVADAAMSDPYKESGLINPLTGDPILTNADRPNMQDMKQAQNNGSTRIDMADRLRKQTALRKIMGR